MQKRTSSIKTLKMQALSILPMHHSFIKFDDLAPVSEEFDLDFDDKNQTHNDNEENGDQHQEFSFTPMEPQGKFIFADEIFDNGWIRPTYLAFEHSPIFTNTYNDDSLPLRPPLKKLFVKQANNVSLKNKELYNDNETSPKTTMLEVKNSNEKCKKSNSTGFSKIWRVRQDLKHRSNSDGKDAFIFLNPSMPLPTKSNKAKDEKIILRKGKGGKCKIPLSAHEKHYMMHRKRKESIKQKSFLPYKQELIGFFANVNGFSRNLHPF